MGMACHQHLVSFHIIVRENNSNLITWTYPTINEDLKKFILNKAFISNETCFAFFKNKYWIYMQQIVDPNTASSNLSGTATVLIAKELNFDKYRAFCEILSKTNVKSKDPVALVHLYLDTYISGSCRYQENGTAIVQDINSIERKSYVKDFIKQFGLEVILLYTALLLKKRVLIYHKTIIKLQKDILSITGLVQCRNPESYLYPFVESFREIETHSFFVAGITDASLQKKIESYDVFVNLATLEIRISPHAKACFAMSKIHKDIATFMVQLSEKETPENEVCAEIQGKTQELMRQLYSLASVTENGRKMITMEDLKNRNFHPTVENFLFNLAVAENMMML